jgi:arabinofuranosyltransferase
MRAIVWSVRSRGGLIVVAIASVFYAIFVARATFSWEGRVGFTLFDDAMISMRYARHLAEGNGLVWNVGEAPIEGYSNPLWTLFMAVVHAGGADDLTASLFVTLAGAMLLLLCAWLSARIASHLIPGHAAALVAMVLTAADYALVFWSLRGMEVALLAACFSGMVLLALRHVEMPTSRRLGGICALAAISLLTRRDASVAVAVCGAYICFRLAGPARWRAAIAIGATFAAFHGAQIAFSTWYFGDPMPNTYYLKLEGTPLTTRLARGVPAAGVVMLRHIGPLLLCAVLASRRTGRGSLVALPLAITAALFAYSAYVGGDAWEFHGYANRYIAPAVPALCAAAAAGLAVLSRTSASARRVTWAVTALAAARLGGDVMLVAIGRAAGRIGPPAICAAAVILLTLLFVRWARQSPALGPASFALLCGVVWMASSGVATANWAVWNASGVSDDANYAQSGLLIRRMTSDNALIAVSMAGNIPYFARRRTIDILGKSDPFIARMKPVQGFYPGHNKWDLHHSIVEPQPDLIWGLPRQWGQVRFLVDLGYTPWRGSVFARRSSARIDYEALSSAIASLYADIPPRRLDE